MNGTIQFGALLPTLLLALRFGGWPERAAALSFCGMIVVDRYYHWLTGSHGTYVHTDWGHLIVDSYMMASLLAITLWADRQWTLWAAAAQVIALLSHPIRLLSGAVDTMAYAILIRAPSWLQLGLILGGIWCHHRRCRMAR
ncbi:MAG: hypothetical protein ABW203_04775 [Novosphingobium sp.]